MNRILVISLAILAVLSSGLFSSCQRGYSGPVESITIGTLANTGDTLIFVADEQKYFADNGLNVTLKTYDNGLAATDALIEGKADLSYAMEFVIVGKALQKINVGIITTYSKAEAVSLIGLKERGIKNISDLKGKRIGLARGTINEFYLGRLLLLNGLSIRDVTLVNVNGPGLGNALTSGEVDAGIAGSRYLYPVVRQQGNKVLVWAAQSKQPAYGALVVKKDWLAHHQGLVKRLLKSLSQAEQYVNSNSDKARTAVQKRLHFDDKDMAEVWSGYQFVLSLDQSLIIAMEDEARWMISNNLTNENTVPNFLDYIYEDALKEIRPEAVNIIRGGYK